MDYDLTSVKAPCPVCYADKGLLLYSINSAQSAQHFVLKEKNEDVFFKLKSHIEKLWRGGKCRIIRCENCSFCFADPFIAGDSTFYRLAYQNGGYPTWKWEHQLTYQIIKQMVDTRRLNKFTLLEIGAGEGAFVKKIAPSLTDKKNVMCTEYSDYGLDKIKDYGIDCLSKDIRKLDDSKLKNYFDVVCLFQVLEHMDDIDTLFPQLARLTKNKASIFISVPNPRRIEFDELNGALLDMPPNHIGRWHESCFHHLCQRYSWKLLNHQVEPFNFGMMFRQFLTYRYLRKSQVNKSYENFIIRINNNLLRKLLTSLSVTGDILSSIPTYRKLISNQFGNSLFVHLET